MGGARLYIVCGLPFAGKSTLVRELTRQRGCRAIDIDALNTARGVGVGGAAITPEGWAASFAAARAATAATLAAGEAVAYDGHRWGRGQRDELRALARAYAAPVTLIVVAVPEVVARERWRANRRAPQRHDVPDALFARAVALFEPPAADEEPWCYDGATPLAAWVAALP